MNTVDTIINARWIIPVVPEEVILDNYSLIIQNGKILHLLPTTQSKKQYHSQNVFDLTTHAVTPGFVNAHTHAAMSLLRGIAEDYSLETWLEKRIWPIENALVTKEFVKDGTILAIAEMILGGTTCMNDMYYYPQIAGEVADKIGMRACVGMIILDFPTVWASSTVEYIDMGLAVHQQFESSTNVTTMLAPHAPYTVSNLTLEKIKSLSELHDLRVHIHLHETNGEIENSLSEHKVRPLERLRQIGLVNRKLLAVHAIHLTDDEISLLGETNSNIAHCPKSNLKLASGICPTSNLLRNNVNIALGTDGAASNNSLNMLEEIRFASLLAKGFSNNAENMNVHDSLKMATINGAQSLGLDGQIGSLESGKLADITAFDLSEVTSLPLYNPVAQIVHSASREQVTHVWIGGVNVLRNRELLSIELEECRYIANKWSNIAAEKVSNLQ